MTKHLTRTVDRPPLRRLALAAFVAALFPMGQAGAAEVIRLQQVEVIGTTPLSGVGLPKEQIPANVQSLATEVIQEPAVANLPDLLNRRLGGVIINEIQGNPFQPDISYRGFTASPLLGTPQGLSVYMDGVRLNQPFGDVVSWDLIPRSAIASMNLMPGSNPLFGLNTLGGALAIQTKDGYSAPGSAVQATYGSHNRQVLEIEHGGHNDKGLNWYVTGNGFKDDGWRKDSPTQLGQFFGKLGWMDAKTELSLTAAMASSKLNGNGLQESRLLDRDYKSVYTKPDETRNRSIFLNLVGKHSLNDDLILSGNTYYRKIRTSTFNGDMNEGSLGQRTLSSGETNVNFPSLACREEVAQGFGPDGMALGEPAEKCNGLINRTQTTQENYGLSAQFTAFGKLGDHKNQFTAGAGYDESRMHFLQTGQFGYLNPDRSITPVNFFADGTELADADDGGMPIDSRVDLSGRTRTWSLFATDTFSFRDLVHLTVSGRYNQTVVRNRDAITPGGGSGSLDGDHRFSRFNPAVGVAVTPSAALNFYAGYNEGSRTPTAIELGCADQNNPCKLPNAMAGDPPLKQVVTKTWEAGVRGSVGARTHWNAGLFRADNYDDILFVAAGTAQGFGYFKNFGQTRRQGIELGVDTQLGDFTLAANYTLLNATFQSGETVNAESNSSAEDEHVAIRPGNRMPLIPRHIFKADADWRINGAWSLGLGMIATSGSLARGNENGQHQPDGQYFLGAGKSSGYTVFNLDAKYRANRQLSFFAHVSNLFDRKYATAAQLGATGFDANGNFVSRPFNPTNALGGDNSVVHSTFYAPGAPRTLWAGVRYEFGK